MLKAITENEELVNVKATKDGKLLVNIGESTGEGTGGETTQEVETTLNASVQTIGTTATTITVNKKVTSIDIANYSENANLTITIGSFSAVIGENLAVSMPTNKNVTNLSITSTEADTKVQLLIKGVE